MRPTPSADFRSFSSRHRRGVWAAPGLLLLLLSASAASAADPSSTAGDSGAVAEPQRAPSVQVIGVGDSLPIDTLAHALGPALRREFDLRFARAARFDPVEWYDRSGQTPFDVRVWVDATTPRAARIYFADRRRQRFLLRRLEISTPPREMDLEALAQVIEWSLRALAQGTIETLTREEAVQLFRPAAAPNGGEEPPAKVSDATGTDGREWRRSSLVLPTLSSFYRLSAYSDAIPIMHGPGARAGFDTTLPSGGLGAGVAAVYLLPQQHADERVGLDVRSLLLRVEMRGLLTDILSHFAVGAFLASGFETTWWSPQVVDTAAYTAASDGSLTTAVLAAGFIGQVRLTSTLRLDLGVELDLDLAAARFDIEMDSGTEPFVVRRRIRPALRLGVELL